MKVMLRGESCVWISRSPTLKTLSSTKIEALMFSQCFSSICTRLMTYMLYELFCHVKFKMIKPYMTKEGKVVWCNPIIL